METRHAESEGRPTLWVLGLLWLIAVGAWGLAPRVDAARSADTPETRRLPTSRSFVGQDSIPALLSIGWSDSLPDGSPSSLSNGDTLRVETRWNRGGLTISANLAELDPNFTSVPLIADSGDDAVYRLEFTSNEYTFDGSKQLPLTVTAPDLAGEYTFDDLVACVSSDPPRLLSLTTLPSRAAYRPNDLLRIESSWIVPFGLDEIYADFGGIAVSPTRFVAADSVAPGRFRVTYRVPVFSAEQAGDYTIPLVCRNTSCGATVDRSLTIRLEANGSTPPVLIDWEVLSPVDNEGNVSPLANGDTIRIRTRWDREGLIVRADTYDLAPEDETRPAVIEVAPGEFEIVYTIPEDNTRADAAGLPFRLIAEDANGESTIDSSIRFCLSNGHPLHLGTRLLRDREVYRGGDTLFVETRWISGSRLPLTVQMDQSRLEPGATAPREATLSETIGDSLYIYDLAYRIPPLRDNRGPDGVGISLPLTCRETGGCDVVRFENLFRFDMDTTAPDTTGPVLDALVEQTTEDSILVSGVTVPEAARVALSRQNSFYSYTTVDSTTGRFSGWVQLLRDTENALRSWAEDELGNRTRSSDPVVVRQVSSLVLDFDQPFLRGGDLSLSDPLGIHDLRLGIYDLEGRLVLEWRESAPFFDRTWVWDGNDADGDPVRQGYYLIRATYRHDDGGKREETTGLVLGD